MGIRYKLFLFALFTALAINTVAQQPVKDTALHIYTKANRQYLRLSSSILEQPLSLVSRLLTRKGINAPPVFESFPGALVNCQYLQFTLKNDDSMQLADAGITGSSIQTTSKYVFAIVEKTDAYRTIDITGFLAGDNDLFFIDKYKKFGLGNYVIDSSSIDQFYNYNGKIDIQTTKAYTKSGKIGLNTSVEIMRDTPVPARNMDPVVPYLTVDSVNKGNPVSTIPGNPVARWNLIPADSEKTNYFNYRLTEPVEPIVFYVDPVTTPAKWVPYVIQGINDWQQAFESAGFKHAITGRLGTGENARPFTLPCRHSGVIVFQKDYTEENATYSTVIDPRSGEILQSYILWNPGVIEWLQKLYFVQVAAIDTGISRLPLPDSLTGELIRMIISHEVGHTLGFPHNFMASNAVPVDNLRSKKWVEENGITASIMDYARCNYVAQPGDDISARKGLINGIGQYDKWAIKWGYRYFENKAAEKDSLNKWIKENNGKKIFLSNLSSGDDPRMQVEDLGDDPLISSAYGIHNLKIALVKLSRWARQSPEDSTRTGNVYNTLIDQYTIYLNHVVTLIGGLYKKENNYDETVNRGNIIEKKKQQKAIQFLKDHLFDDTDWILNDTLERYAHSSHSQVVASISQGIFTRLLSSKVVARLSEAYKISGNKSYLFSELLNDIRQSLFKVTIPGDKLSVSKKGLQLEYLSQLRNLLTSANQPAAADIKATLVQIKNALLLSHNRFKETNHIHLQQVITMIDEISVLPVN